MFFLYAFQTLVVTPITLGSHLKISLILRALMLIFKIHVTLSCFSIRKSEEILSLIITILKYINLYEILKH